MKNFVAYVRNMLKGKPFMNVYAEEPITPIIEPKQAEPVPPTPKADPTPQGTVNFEDLVGKARKEERDKLYPQLEKLKAEKNNLLLVLGERDATITGLEKQLATLDTTSKKLAQDLEDGTKTNKTVSEMTLTISKLESQLEDLQIQYEDDVNNLKVDSYKEKQIALAGGEIIPELVTGTTEEEINESIELAKTRYAEITQRAVQNVQLPTANPSSAHLQIGKELSFEQMSSMSTADWAEARKQMGLK